MKTVKIIITLITCLITTMSFSQSRVNIEKINFSSKSKKLEQAIGWEQNTTTGDWSENENVIHYKKCETYWVSHVTQNFKWLQFATVQRNNINYYVFLYETFSGRYKYPSIREDWESEMKTHFFIITEEQFKELKDKLKLNNGETINLKTSMIGQMSNKYNSLGGQDSYNEENLLNRIRNIIDKPGYSELCFTLNSQNVDGKNVVRFRLPESCLMYGDYIKTKYFEVLSSEFETILSY